MCKQKKDNKYADAGVDIDAGNNLVDILRPIVANTFKHGVITDIGGFAGVFSLDVHDIENPVLVSSTDGVGTKLKIAFLLDKHDTIGIDLVAMCVNDIIVKGATPLFMLDYISMGKLDVDKAKEIVKGIVTGCLEAECALIGGETAEMPGFYAEGEYDIAGFAVGLTGNADILDGSEIAVGSQLVGIGSSGLHSNGYSLVRKIFFDELQMSVYDYVEEFGRTLGEELLEPTKIYVRIIKSLKRDFSICGISHITGGGLTDNIPRILPKRCKAVIDTSSWSPQPIFSYLKRAGDLSNGEMMRTFNNGIGLVIVVNEDDVNEIILRLKAMDEIAYHIGSVEARKDGDEAVQFIM